MRDEAFTPREIPPEKRDFQTMYQGDKKVVALFDPAVKYRLIETYGLDCFTESNEGLRFEMDFTERDYMLNWLLGFGGKVKVLEPDYIVADLKAAAENILKNHK